MNTTTTQLLRLAVLSAGLALAATDCSKDQILGVNRPDIVTPDNLSGPSALPTIRAGALGDFTVSYSGSGAEGSGGTEGVIMTSGLLADELVNSETFPTRIEIDRRGPILVDNGTAQNWFRTLSRARRSTDFATRKYRDFSDPTKFSTPADTTQLTGFPEVLTLAGYTYLFFAENYCSGVPFSTAQDDGTLVYGTPLTTAQMYDSALSKFNQALAAANALTITSTSTKNRFIQFAQLGRARTFLDIGQFANASAAVTAAPAVPVTFNYVVTHSENTARENNGVFNANTIFKRYAVADQEGNYASSTGFLTSGTGPGLPFRSSKDARILWRIIIRAPVPPAIKPDTNKGFDGQTPQFDELRYPDRKTSVTLATGAEAQLILAEAALQAGDTVTNAASFYTFLNALRASTPSYFNPPAPAAPIAAMGPLTTDSATAAGGAVRLLFKERAYWLWLTGHRLNDLRRLVRTVGVRGGYGFPVNTVFPTGNYFKQGFTYGPDVNFPVPVDELNNPNFTQCADRAP